MRRGEVNDWAERVSEIQALTALGYRVEKLSPTHFRVNDRVDFYPKAQRFHHLGSEKRGSYTTALDCMGHWQAWAART